MPTEILLVACIVVFAHFIETSTGFGATVIAVALAAHVVPIKILVVTLVLIAWLQSAWIISRSFRHIRWDVLLKRILPFTLLGLPIGIWSFSALGSAELKVILGVFVMAVSLVELVRLFRSSAAPKPLSLGVSIAVLLGGGVFHGLFASGGPLVVYFASRGIEGKRSFRATLSVLWIMLNTTLIVTYLVSGRMEKESIVLAAWMLPALVIGIIAGEISHAKINEKTFRKLVQAILFFTGVFLVI
ncbi:MAG: sulfite exporter TauE/SafE family protein [Pseudomonadota bacterium]